MSSAKASLPEANMFANSTSPSFVQSECKAAGRDVVGPVFNINITAPSQQAQNPHPDPSDGDLSRTNITPPERGSADASQLVRWLLGLLRLEPQLKGPPGEPDNEEAEPRLTSSSGTPLTHSGGPIPSPPESPGASDDTSVSLADDLDPRVLGPHKLTTPQVYVRCMLRAGKGLPCWKPRPRKPGEGIVPGDVGKFSPERGFRKIFNLWDDQEALMRLGAATYSSSPEQNAFQLPQRRIVVHEEEFPRGHTLAEGASSQKFYSQDDALRVDSYDFHCQSERGAIFAATSPAVLEELEDSDCIELRDVLALHAALIYTHANNLQRLGASEALYVVTGCTKSDSWAIAAFKEPVKVAPHDMMRLESVKAANPTDYVHPKFIWTKMVSSSEAHCWSNEVEEQKDQTLFLLGFKLDFSQSFRIRMKPQISPGSSAGPSEDPDNSSSNNEGPRSGGEGRERGSGANGPGLTRGGDPSRGSNSSPSDKEGDLPGDDDTTEDPSSWPAWTSQLPSQPPASSLRFAAAYHPSDLINWFLLRKSGSDFALCHDDEWRFSSGNSGTCMNPFPGVQDGTLSESGIEIEIGDLHGVAVLSTKARDNDKPIRTSESGQRPAGPKQLTESARESGSIPAGKLAREPAAIQAGLSGYGHRFVDYVQIVHNHVQEAKYVVEEDGPTDARTYTCRLFVNDVLQDGEGVSRTKKGAKKICAYKYLKAQGFVVQNPELEP